MSRVTGLAACDWYALMCLDKRVSVVGRTQEQLEQRVTVACEYSATEHNVPIAWKDESGEIVAFCIVHFDKEIRVNGLGNAYFSTLIALPVASVLQQLMCSSVEYINSTRLLPERVSDLVGPLHSSFLIERGLRTFESDFNVFSLPSNTVELTHALTQAGCRKEKDLIEIVFQPPSHGYQQHALEEKLTRRLADIEFHHCGQDELIAKSQLLADCYNQSWERNWGYSPASREQFEIASRNIKNISAIIAEHDAKVVGFTMFAPAMNEQGLYGRAFFTGVAPEYQLKGLSVALTLKLAAIALNKVGRSKISLSWMLEDNVMVLRTMRHLTRDGICHERAYRIYRYTASVE